MAGARANIALVMMLLAKSRDEFEGAVSEEIGGFDLNRCIDKFKEAMNRDGEAKAKLWMSISLLANGRDDEAIKLAREALEIAEESPNEHLKAVCELTLAYILMVSKLDEFGGNKSITKLIDELTFSAHERFDKLNFTGVCISSAIGGIERYLLGYLDFDELLKGLDELTSNLEEMEDKSKEWVLKRVKEAIEREGIDEEALRTTIIKLLLII